MIYLHFPIMSRTPLRNLLKDPSARNSENEHQDHITYQSTPNEAHSAAISTFVVNGERHAIRKGTIVAILRPVKVPIVNYCK